MIVIIREQIKQIYTVIEYFSILTMLNSKKITLSIWTQMKNI